MQPRAIPRLLFCLQMLSLERRLPASNCPHSSSSFQPLNASLERRLPASKCPHWSGGFQPPIALTGAEASSLQLPSLERWLPPSNCPHWSGGFQPPNAPEQRQYTVYTFDLSRAPEGQLFIPRTHLKKPTSSSPSLTSLLILLSVPSTPEGHVSVLPEPRRGGLPRVWSPGGVAFHPTDVPHKKRAALDVPPFFPIFAMLNLTAQSS